ncbi:MULTISPECIES: hypothetical protein [Acidiphilium]|uniref:Uncharacterized protein n=1 Tax=Acidiphilium rubrum TaxID=526 RepID=A0A8G2FCP1_ACIRU|nr:MULTISPECIES: hypothetical protein [Acidiphilium]SIQ46336.1 hypothetical protein SAMN05421828_10523 [Acidiphilium rubrum]
MAELTITEWKPLRRNSLRGFATVTLPSGMILHEILIHNTPDGPWAAPPSKPMIGRDGVAMKDAAGKARYSPIISFADKATRERWSSAIIAALLASYPDALAGGAE